MARKSKPATFAGETMQPADSSAEPMPLEMPGAGGSYVRCPVTGALTPDTVTPAPVDAEALPPMLPAGSYVVCQETGETLPAPEDQAPELPPPAELLEAGEYVTDEPTGERITVQEARSRRLQRLADSTNTNTPE
ncbi:hypothetical protein [Hydrocarboniphaga sp.]|uniref:hypothetical protein n=1 Tax=Hydrocarboniphaga sp. TaxID=2033016 RepID=UPI003D1269A4